MHTTPQTLTPPTSESLALASYPNPLSGVHCGGLATTKETAMQTDSFRRQLALAIDILVLAGKVS